MKEKELEDKLEINLNKIEQGLTLIERQKRISTGIIDLFCKDRNGKYVIIEIKIKPNAKVVAQLAKYNMALIKSGINKRNLRTILIASEFTKEVKNICEFFKFETKKVYKRIISNKKKILNSKFNESDKEKLIQFIEKKRFINQSMAARFLNIQNYTAKNLINELHKDNIVNITHLYGQKFIQLRKD